MRIPGVFTRSVALATLAVLPVIPVLAACDAGGEDSRAASEAPERPATDAAPTPAVERAPRPASGEFPDTTAAAVWAYLQDVGYADAWRMWPGRGELYPGTEPHGMLLSTWLNDIAFEALTAATGPLPSGSIVVKENYRPDSTLAAVTVMYAREGYDPEHDDWFWAKYLPGGDVEAAGRVAPCQECHQAGERGFLRTPYSP